VPSDEIEQGLVDELLALEAREQQSELLHARGLLHAEGLDRLLDAADGLLNSDPGKAQRLAELCVEVAGCADAPAAVPRANYLSAGVHFMNGRFDEDLRLSSVAYDGYVSLGMNVEALRTKAGRMSSLIELGRHAEALDVGRDILDTLEGKGKLSVRPTQPQSDLLNALVHQNQAICYWHTGRYDRALDALAVAEKHYQSLGANERVGEIIDNRAVILRYLGRSSEALAVHETAAGIFKEAGLTHAYATALGNIGETHSQLGNYARSLDAFERARRLLSSLDAPVNEHVIVLDTANTYLALNLYPEALAAYREANQMLEDSAITFELARGLWGMGSALIACSRFEEAEQALDQAAASFAAADNIPLLSGVMLEQASLLAARGDRQGALTTVLRALEIVRESAWPVEQVYARLRLADLLMPDTGKAEPHLLAARRLADNLALPQLRYRLKERLGHLRRLQGRDEEALVLLEEAVDEIERLRGSVVQDAMRASFLRDKTAAYEDLLLLHLAREDEEGARRAFVVAERAKSRALVDLLVGVAEKEPVGSADPELGRRLRTSQADLNAIYGELLGGAGDDGSREGSPGGGLARLSNLHARGVELEQEISRLRLQAAAVEPGADPFAASGSVEDVRDRLPSDSTLLAYHVVGDEVMAFIDVHGRIQVPRGLSTVGTVEGLLRKLNVQWERFRAGREFAGRHMATLERSTRQVLTALYKELVEPLEPLLESAAARVSGENSPVPKLALVPHGALHRIPFHALFDGEKYLIERFEVSYAPSATVYSLCQEREPRDRGKAAVFGVEDPSIPAAAAEASTVAGCLPDARVIVSDAATLARLRDEAAGCDALHLACHGLFRADNPMFSALKLHDGWLTAADAVALDLLGALVTLSACESGRGGVIGGDEVLGLTRGFLGAGAATLVVSLWLVQDETTAELMEGYYGRMGEGMGRAGSLRASQLEMKERYPHPYYWAPFVLIGKG
jgi:tetratricopeptide (TPR) repeat protein